MFPRWISPGGAEPTRLNSKFRTVSIGDINEVVPRRAEVQSLNTVVPGRSYVKVHDCRNELLSAGCNFLASTRKEWSTGSSRRSTRVSVSFNGSMVLWAKSAPGRTLFSSLPSRYACPASFRPSVGSHRVPISVSHPSFVRSPKGDEQRRVAEGKGLGRRSSTTPACPINCLPQTMKSFSQTYPLPCTYRVIPMCSVYVLREFLVERCRLVCA